MGWSHSAGSLQFKVMALTKDDDVSRADYLQSPGRSDTVEARIFERRVDRKRRWRRGIRLEIGLRNKHQHQPELDRTGCLLSLSG